MLGDTGMSVEIQDPPAGLVGSLRVALWAVTNDQLK